jgi:hypothetical protein
MTSRRLISTYDRFAANARQSVSKLEACSTKNGSETMASITPRIAKSIQFAGLEQIFEYCNWDGELTRWNCGQAAAATLLNHLDKPATLKDADDAVRAIERRFPPDQFGGWLGTGRRRVKEILREHGAQVNEIRGERRLRAEIERGNPVIVMLGVSGGTFWKWELPGGHWMVAYAFDDENVYLTNWTTPMPWGEFRVRWRSIVSSWIQMAERGLTAVM